MGTENIVTYKRNIVGRLDVMSNNGSVMKPGSIVICRGLEKSTEGIVIGTDETNSWVTVMWHKWPNPKTIFTMPNIRNVTFPIQGISQSIFNIQPMTIPTGGIFYLDYTYRDGKKSSE